MESTSRLKLLLRAALEGALDQSAVPDLFDELESRKETLATLFNVGPKSAAEQRELESGTSTNASFHGLASENILIL